MTEIGTVYVEIGKRRRELKLIEDYKEIIKLSAKSSYDLTEIASKMNNQVGELLEKNKVSNEVLKEAHESWKSYLEELAKLSQTLKGLVEEL